MFLSAQRKGLGSLLSPFHFRARLAVNCQSTWENLSNWCGVPLYGDRGGPPYGNAYGYYSHGPGKQWNGPGRSDGDGHYGKRLKKR